MTTDKHKANNSSEKVGVDLKQEEEILRGEKRQNA